MTKQGLQKNGGPTVTQADEWDDGAAEASADAYINPPDAETDTPAEEPVVSDLSALMQPDTDDQSDEAVISDLSALLQPTDAEPDTPTPTLADVKANAESEWNTPPGEDDIIEERIPLGVFKKMNEKIESREKQAPKHVQDWERLTEPTPYRKLEGAVAYVSPRAALSQKFRHYIEMRWYPQCKYYDEKAAYNKARHLNLQIFIALGSVSVPIIIGIGFIPKWIPALISGLVAIFTAIENVMKYGDNWRAFRSAAEGLTREKVLYEAMSGPYANTRAPFRMFVERCEDVIAEETGRYFERGPEESEGDTNVQKDGEDILMD